MTIRANRRAFLKSTVAAAAGSSLASVHSPWILAAPKASDGISLFDGESLDGWHKNPQKIGHGTGGRWRAEDGAIVGEQEPPGSGNGGILLTDKKFGDFELLIAVQVHGGNGWPHGVTCRWKNITVRPL